MNATLAEPTTITLLVQSDYFNRVIFMIAIAILYFEFVLTLPLEVERFWGRPSGWASTLFYINRYTSIIFHLPVLYKYFWSQSESSCDKVQFLHEVLLVVSQGIVIILLIVRTYALYECNRKVAIFLSSIAIFGGILGGWSITQMRGSAYDPLNTAAQLYDHGCLQVLSRSQGAHYAIPWIVALVFDTTVFALTLSRALKFGLAWRSGMFYIILRDGTVYFGILVVSHLSNVITFVYAQPGYRGWLATLTNVLSSTLVTRMMLNIRDRENLMQFPSSRLSRDRPLQLQPLHTSTLTHADV